MCANTKSEMGERRIITKILDKIKGALYCALRFFNTRYLMCDNLLIFYSFKNFFCKENLIKIKTLSI